MYTIYCLLQVIFTTLPGRNREMLSHSIQDSLQRREIHYKIEGVFPNLTCMSGGSEAPPVAVACGWLCTSKKVTSPFSLPFYWTPRPHKLGLWSASLSLRPSPQHWARYAGPTLAGFLEAPMARLCGVTSACFAKNIRWLFLTQPTCKRWQEQRPSSSFCCLPSLCGSSEPNNKTTFLCSPIILITINSNCSLSASQKVHTNYVRIRVMR